MQYGHIYTTFCIIIKLKVMFWKLYTRIYFDVRTFKIVVAFFQTLYHCCMLVATVSRMKHRALAGGHGVLPLELFELLQFICRIFGDILGGLARCAYWRLIFSHA